MDPQQITTMFAEINAKLDTLKTFRDRLTEVAPESPTCDQTLPRNNQHNNTDNPSNHDAQYLKSIRSMSPILMDVTTHNFS